MEKSAAREPRERSAGPPFGLPRQQPMRVELVFLLKSGGSMTIYHNLGEPVTEERLAKLASELSDQLRHAPEPRLFVDEWGATGQQAWVDLSQVAAFALRPAR